MSSRSPEKSQREGDAPSDTGNIELLRVLLEEQRKQSAITQSLVEKLSESASTTEVLGKTLDTLERTVGLQDTLLQTLKVIVSGTNGKPQDGLVWLVAQLNQTFQRGQSRETTFVERIVLPLIVSTAMILIGLAVGHFLVPK